MRTCFGCQHDKAHTYCNKRHQRRLVVGNYVRWEPEQFLFPDGDPTYIKAYFVSAEECEDFASTQAQQSD